MPIAKENYSWLDEKDIGILPRMVVEARKLHGVVEVPGPANSDTVMGWAHEIGGKVEDQFYADSVYWCGLFAAIVAKRAGKTPPVDPLWALNWGKFGMEAGQPALGDILTFTRSGGGHVAIYIGEDKDSYHVLGGNQSNQVCFEQYAKSRLKAARTPLYMNRPASAIPYVLTEAGGRYKTK